MVEGKDGSIATLSRGSSAKTSSVAHSAAKSELVVVGMALMYAVTSASALVGRGTGRVGRPGRDRSIEGAPTGVAAKENEDGPSKRSSIVISGAAAAAAASLALPLRCPSPRGVPVGDSLREEAPE